MRAGRTDNSVGFTRLGPREGVTLQTIQVGTHPLQHDACRTCELIAIIREKSLRRTSHERSYCRLRPRHAAKYVESIIMHVVLVRALRYGSVRRSCWPLWFVIGWIINKTSINCAAFSLIHQSSSRLQNDGCTVNSVRTGTVPLVATCLLYTSPSPRD